MSMNERDRPIQVTRFPAMSRCPQRLQADPDRSPQLPREEDACQREQGLPAAEERPITSTGSRLDTEHT